MHLVLVYTEDRFYPNKVLLGKDVYAVTEILLPTLENTLIQKDDNKILHHNPNKTSKLDG